jgi:hypothetical protein
MSAESSFQSIAEALAAAEKKKSAKPAAVARKAPSPWFAGAPSTAPGAAPAAKTPAAKPAARPSTTANVADLRDDFDYAIEAVETARETMGRDKAKAEQMATNFLMAKRQMSRQQAADLVKRALRYIDS